jgi:hypothetical protein
MMPRISLTNLAGQDLLIVDVRLHPCHELFNVGGGGHLGWPLVVLVVLPEVLESNMFSWGHSDISSL